MEECPICYENIRYPSCIIPCNHMFCEPCINKWLMTKQTCPVCRIDCNLYSDNKIKMDYKLDKNLTRTIALARGF